MLTNYLKNCQAQFVQELSCIPVINILGLGNRYCRCLIKQVYGSRTKCPLTNISASHNRVAQVMLNQTSDGETYTGKTVAMPVGDALRSKYARGSLSMLSLTSYEFEYLVGAGDKKVFP